MPSNDMRICIERYPFFGEDGDLINVSYGCPDLNLMGYDNIKELLDRVMIYFDECEIEDIECNEDGTRREK